MFRFSAYAIMFMVAIVLLPLIGVLVGAFCGWIVGIFWPATFAAVSAHFGIAAFAPWQIGAALGFVGGFFKASTQTKGE